MDNDRAVSFYCDALGMKLLFGVSGQSMAFFNDLDGNDLALMEEPPAS